MAARVVEVIADRGEGGTPRFRLGSGCIVAGRTVLTAAHVVVGAVSVMVRGPDKVPRQATVVPGCVGDADGPGPDLALVEMTGGADMPAMGLAAVDRDSPAGDLVEGCHVLGYPAFMERAGPDGGRFRETADASGQVLALSGLAGGLLSVQVSSAPEQLPRKGVKLGDSPWSGMSGGPVVAEGFLLGVVTDHADRAGPSAITATPLTALEHDPAHPGRGPGVTNPAAWWACLGTPGIAALRRLPEPAGRRKPAYWATVAEISQQTKVLALREVDDLPGQGLAADVLGLLSAAGGPLGVPDVRLGEGMVIEDPSSAPAPSRLIRTLTGHNGAVSGVAFSPDGRLLATGSRDATVRLWDVTAGTTRRSLVSHTGETSGVAFSPDGTLLATAGDDRIVRLWDVAAGMTVRSLAGHTGYVYCVAFSPDGTILATGSRDRTVRLWDTGTGAFLHILTGHIGAVSGVAFSPDGITLATGSLDRTVRLWDTGTGTFLHVLTGHTREVQAVAFSPDGVALASTSADRTIRLWC
jgi:hypothetical protein